MDKLGALTLACVVLAVTITAGTPPVVAQSANAPTATPTGTATVTDSGDSTNTTYVAAVDGSVRVVDFWMQDNEMVIVFESDTIRQVTVFGAIDTSGSGAGEGAVRQKTLPPGKTRLRIPSDSVSITTPQSIEDGRYVALEESTALISGPYDGDDVWTAGAFAALGVAVSVLYRAAKAKAGVTNRGERLA